MDADTISKMTRQQRLQAMESLWDALVHETVEPVSPDWHQAVLALSHQGAQGAKAADSCEAGGVAARPLRRTTPDSPRTALPAP